MKIPKHSVIVCLIMIACIGAGILVTSAGITIPPATGNPGGIMEPVGADSEINAVSVIDSFGNTLSLPRPAGRIICQNGDAADMLINIGAGDSIVGVYDTLATTPGYQHYIPNAVSIGNWQSPDVEQIIALNPDVIIMYSGFRPRNYELIESNNISIVYLDCYKISELAANARALGNLTGMTAEAEMYAGFVDRYTGIVRSRVNGSARQSAPLRVYAELYGDYSALGKDSSGDRLISMLGAENIARDIPLQSSSTNKVSSEWIIEQDPDIILKIAASPSDVNPSLADVRQNIIDRPGFGKIDAVKNNRVYVIDGNMLNGPTGPVGLMYIAKSFYPDLFSDISPDEVYREYATMYPFITEFSRQAVMVPSPG